MTRCEDCGAIIGFCLCAVRKREAAEATVCEFCGATGPTRLLRSSQDSRDNRKVRACSDGPSGCLRRITAAITSGRSEQPLTQEATSG